MSDTETRDQPTHMCLYRDAIERVRALADEWASRDPVFQRDQVAVGCGLRLRDVLAPVSSGETESGVCGHPNHGAEDHDCTPFTPAPVLSGGQAGGEGEDAATLAQRMAATAAEIAYSTATDYGQALHGLMLAAGYVPASRPVLSREALTGVLAEVADERARQDERWGEQNHPDGTGPENWWPGIFRLPMSKAASIAKQQVDFDAKNDRVTYAEIFLEEVFEGLCEANPTRLREELIQVAAVAVAWVEAIDRRAAVLSEGQEAGK